MVVIFILGLHIYLEYIDPFIKQSMDFLSKPYLLVLGLFASIIATRLLFHVSAPSSTVS